MLLPVFKKVIKAIKLVPM